MRGEYARAQETAETFLREAEAEGRAMEAGAARRMLGYILFAQGDFKAARSILERALADYVAERDGETQFRFNRDTEVTLAAYLAVAEWHLGEFERARQLIAAIQRANELGHVAAVANALFFKTILERCRDDVSAASLAADAVLEVAENYSIKTYGEMGRMYAIWARGRLNDPQVAANELKKALAAFIAQGNKVNTPIMLGMLAELEATARGPERALTLIDQGLAMGMRPGNNRDSYLHRLRGDILFKRDLADSVAAEEAYQTAIAVAKGQSARSYELLASLSLAKLYQSTARPADAHAVLAPALEGFSPTPEMPEIAEAQALLVAIEAGAHMRHE